MRRMTIPSGKRLLFELQQINEYETITDVSHHTKAKIPNGYKKIKFVFDVKHYGCHKARLVAVGHLTEFPLESRIWLSLQ
jgi:hypothetical protein